MRWSSRILLFGHDPKLLETRRQILTRAGFDTWIAMNEDFAIHLVLTKLVDLLILAELSAEECESILKNAYRVRPQMRNLILSIEAFDLKSMGCGPAAEIFDPDRFLQLIKNGLTRQHAVSIH
jgi:hypothetical protein